MKRRHDSSPLPGAATRFLARGLEILAMFDKSAPKARIARFFSTELPCGT